jgi:hypothetical protein
MGTLQRSNSMLPIVSMLVAGRRAPHAVVSRRAPWNHMVEGLDSMLQEQADQQKQRGRTAAARWAPWYVLNLSIEPDTPQCKISARSVTNKVKGFTLVPGRTINSNESR